MDLRRTADSLNDRITSVLQLLADTRTEVLATPATVFPATQREVPYAELLNYAKNISKYSRPPRLHPNQIPQMAQLEQQDNIANGTVSPTVQVEAISEPPLSQPPEKNSNPGIASLSQLELQWLDPLTQVPFVPWPSEDTIRSGALAQLQVMHEQGIDPEDLPQASLTHDPGEEGPVKVEDRGVKQLDPLNNETVATKNESNLSGIGRVKEEKPSVFGGMDLYDPEDED